MTYPGQRVQVDVKVVPCCCITDPELHLFQYTAIDEFSRLRFLAAYPEQSTYSSADFLKRLVKWYARKGIHVECVQTDNSPTAFLTANAISKPCLNVLPPNWGSVPILPGTTARSSAATARIRNASTLAARSIPWMTLQSSLPSTTVVPTTYP